MVGQVEGQAETYEDDCPSYLEEEEVESVSLVVQGEACLLVALVGVLVELVFVLVAVK